MFKDIAELVYYTDTVDADGFTIATETHIDVYVNVKSVGRQEKYLAMSAGINPTIIFELREEDWELCKHTVDSRSRYADKIRYDGELFNFIKSYATKGMVEVTCG
jgi:hypothetical protein